MKETPRCAIGLFALLAAAIFIGNQCRRFFGVRRADQFKRAAPELIGKIPL